MKRGTRILLILIILIVILAVAAFLIINSGGGLISLGSTTQEKMVDIVVLSQPVSMDSEVTEAALTTMPYPQSHLNPSMIIEKNQVIGKFAKYQLGAGLPLTMDMLQERPGMSQIGSQAAKTIPAGMVAVSIPISQLSSVAYGVKDGDKVNLIVTASMYDVESDTQTKLPNDTSQVMGVGPDNLVAKAKTENFGQREGKVVMDNTLGQPMYLVPSEAQRPRIVTQTLLQDIQILHVGDFDTEGVVQTAAVEGQPTPTPAPTFLPNVVTLLVSPQDAVVLTYLLNIKATFTMVLRAPDDTTKLDTEAATLQYLLSQYNIPVPPKMPYIIDNEPYSPVPAVP